MTIPKICDVGIIGAGPASSIAGALLAEKGYHVVMLERQNFPRFSIGESLLPCSMEILEQANMTNAIVAAKFQEKNGAAFDRDGMRAIFDFSDKFSSGCATAYEVQRDQFDSILADQAAERGASVNFGCEITSVDIASERPILRYLKSNGSTSQLSAKYCLDGSGFGQTLARLHGLVLSSDWPIRESIFTHITDHLKVSQFDRTKILITVHPRNHNIWFWLIPFSDGTSSIGAVAPAGSLSNIAYNDEEVLRSIIADVPSLTQLLENCEFHKPCSRITGYASEVKKSYGENYAMLGNASGFLDPIFSSGVTIALKSASLAVDCLDRQLSGDTVDWERDFSVPLKLGINTFRQFVAAWYDGKLQDIIFATNQNHRVRQMLCSILAGYAWDTNNPYVTAPKRRLSALAELSRN